MISLIINSFFLLVFFELTGPAESNLFCTPPSSLHFTQTVCVGALNQVLAVNLKWHGYQNIARKRWTQQRKWAQCILPFWLEVSSFCLPSSSPISFYIVRMSVTDWLGQGSVTHNMFLLFIGPYGLRSLRFNESPFVLAGQNLSVYAPVRWCEE